MESGRMRALVLLICCLSSCRAEENEGRLQIELPQGRIVGGHAAAPHAYPYQVSLQTKFLWLRAHTCGGSLLNNYWILTAAHCISESLLVGLLPMDAVAGAHDVNSPGYSAQIARVIKRITHPLYQGGVGPNDIAVLKTKVPFTFTRTVQPIRLPSAAHAPAARSLLTLTGWGLLRTSFFPDLPTHLQEVKVPFLPFKDCYKAIEELKDYPEEENPLSEQSNLCTGPLTGGVAACNGDSGGPLVEFLSTGDQPGSTPEGNADPVEDDEDNEVGSDDATPVVETASDGPKKRGTRGERHALKPRPCMAEASVAEARGTAVLVGVVSWGMTPCGSDGAPTVYTNVASFLDFINSHIH